MGNARGVGRSAPHVASRHAEDSSFLFGLWPCAAAGDAALVARAREILADHGRKNLGSATKVAQVRHLFGADVRWTAEIPDLDA